MTVQVQREILLQSICHRRWIHDRRRSQTFL